jgi:hypothetical protein
MSREQNWVYNFKIEVPKRPEPHVLKQENVVVGDYLDASAIFCTYKEPMSRKEIQVF